jgi:hypothetical protein
LRGNDEAGCHADAKRKHVFPIGASFLAKTGAVTELLFTAAAAGGFGDE